MGILVVYAFVPIGFFLIQLYVFLFSLTRQLTHRSLENPCVHKVLEVRISEVRLHELCLFLQHGSDDVDNVIIEGNLSHLLATVANGICKVNTCYWQIFITVFMNCIPCPFDCKTLLLFKKGGGLILPNNPTSEVAI